jgi:hypothetical protein
MAYTKYPAVPATAITAATAQGLITVASNTAFAAGAIAFLNKAGVQMRVKILALVGATQLLVRQAYERVPGITADQTPAAAFPGPNYGGTDVSAFAAASTINMPPQAVFDNVNADPIPLPA